MRKYAIKLIPLKSYKKSLVFLLAETIKGIRNHFLKLEKVFSQYLILFKGYALLYSNASQYHGAIKAYKKIATPRREYRQKNLSTIADFGC